MSDAHLHVCCLKSTLRVHPALFFEIWEIAISMAEGRETHVVVDRKHWTGEVTTAWREGMLGCIGGYIFDATVDAKHGSGTVRFIVRDPTDRVALEMFRAAFMAGAVERSPSHDDYGHFAVAPDDRDAAKDAPN